MSAQGKGTSSPFLLCSLAVWEEKMQDWHLPTSFSLSKATAAGGGAGAVRSQRLNPLISLLPPAKFLAALTPVGVVCPGHKLH